MHTGDPQFLGLKTIGTGRENAVFWSFSKCWHVH